MVRITNLRLEKLSVHITKIRKGLVENNSELHLPTVLLKMHQGGISVVTPRTAISTRSSIGFKKEGGLEKISSKTITWVNHSPGKGPLLPSVTNNRSLAVCLSEKGKILQPRFDATSRYLRLQASTWMIMMSSHYGYMQDSMSDPT